MELREGAKQPGQGPDASRILNSRAQPRTPAPGHRGRGQKDALQIADFRQVVVDDMRADPDSASR